MHTFDNEDLSDEHVISHVMKGQLRPRAGTTIHAGSRLKKSKDVNLKRNFMGSKPYATQFDLESNHES